MSTHDIKAVGHDTHGRFYDIADDCTYDGVTVDEAEGTVTLHTLHGNSPLEDALNNLIAIERDRLLGYPSSELHMQPETALTVALTALDEQGRDVEFLIMQDDQAALPIDFDQFGGE